MDPRILLARVGDDPVDPAELAGLVERAAAGAVALFVGRVRDHDPESAGEVVALEYTCHPTAPDRIGQIVTDALAEAGADDQVRVATVHRTGRLAVGDAAFVVAVSSPHRAQAFAVCQLVVDRVKQHLPVWKQQFEADGSYRWSGMA